MDWLLDIIEAGLSLFGWFKKSQGEQLGQSKQQNQDDKATLKTAKDAININNEVAGSNDAELDDKLSQRLRDNLHQ
jgi:hypothetical protein